MTIHSNLSVAVETIVRILVVLEVVERGMKVDGLRRVRVKRDMSG